MKKYIITVGIILFSLSFVLAQNPKKIYKAGIKLIEENKLEEAIGQFNQAIELNAEYTDAYIARAEAYEKSNKKSEAIADYEKALKIDAKLTNVHFKVAKVFYDQEDYLSALNHLNEATLLDRKFINAIQLKIYTLIKLGEFETAVIESNKALEISKTFIYHYTHGVASDSLGNTSIAEQDYNKAIELKPNFKKGYFALTKAFLKLNKLDDALEIANKAITKFVDDNEAYYNRSLVFKTRSDYPSAINDLSKIIVSEPNNEEVLLLRGICYQDFSQHQNAITDFNKIITINQKNPQAYITRAESYEEITNFKAAISDYETYLQIAEETSNNQFANLATKKLYNLKREEEKPNVIFIEPTVLRKDVMGIVGNAVKVLFTGYIEDASKIESFKIDDVIISLSNTDEHKNAFSHELIVDNKSSIKIEAVDVYKNTLLSTIVLERMEINPPVISLLTPYASDNGEVYLESNDANLFIEGHIEDENLIKEIFVDDLIASFSSNTLNPNFTANINITNKHKIIIKAIDKYGNTTEKLFTFNREGATIAENNPMGKTWVIFIENSNYATFASLEGPVKDVSEMKKALSNYQIHKIIHKKDLTKKDFGRFFAIELRDLVKNNNVNSILVWYAGHGKFINETGYWIPVDATRDDEFTYYNINSLRAAMQSYSNFITHTLVITDACESGPSFYQAMRSTPKIRSCTDYKATKFKSSQIFSSAGYELAVDNSQFTKTFAKSLSYNTDACIPIESIVIKVTEAVEKNNAQKPLFGKIYGLEDENGTFFFIKKE